jgi:hypothetical protein
MSGKTNTPRALIVTGLISLVVTICYFLSIHYGTVIYYTSIDLFKWYGWCIIIIGVGLTGWWIWQAKNLKKSWPLLLILTLNILLVTFFTITIKHYPQRLRLSLTNNTTYDLTEVRIGSNAEVSLGTFMRNSSAVLSSPDYVGKSGVYMTYKMNGAIDTLTLLDELSGSCGYYYSFTFVEDKGTLRKQ